MAVPQLVAAAQLPCADQELGDGERHAAVVVPRPAGELEVRVHGCLGVRAAVAVAALHEQVMQAGACRRVLNPACQLPPQPHLRLRHLPYPGRVGIRLRVDLRAEPAPRHLPSEREAQVEQHRRLQCTV